MFDMIKEISEANSWQDIEMVIQENKPQYENFVEWFNVPVSNPVLTQDGVEQKNSVDMVSFKKGMGAMRKELLKYKIDLNRDYSERDQNVTNKLFLQEFAKKHPIISRRIIDGMANLPNQIIEEQSAEKSAPIEKVADQSVKSESNQLKSPIKFLSSLRDKFKSKV